MPFAIGSGKRGLAHSAQAVQRRDGDPSLVTRKRRRNGGERVPAPQAMRWHPDRNVGDRNHLAWKRNGRGRGPFRDKIMGALARTGRPVEV
jgi:hypothetical protein